MTSLKIAIIYDYYTIKFGKINTFRQKRPEAIIAPERFLLRVRRIIASYEFLGYKTKLKAVDKRNLLCYNIKAVFG